MARPPLYAEPRVATAVRLPESMHRRLHQEASEREVSANLLVTRAISEYLDRLVPMEKVLSAGSSQRPGGSS